MTPHLVSVVLTLLLIQQDAIGPPIKQQNTCSLCCAFCACCKSVCDVWLHYQYQVWKWFFKEKEGGRARQSELKREKKNTPETKSECLHGLTWTTFKKESVLYEFGVRAGEPGGGPHPPGTGPAARLLVRFARALGEGTLPFQQMGMLVGR